MFRATASSSDWPPVDLVLDRFEARFNTVGPDASPIGLGHNRPPIDPLASLTKKQIFVDCIWISDESSTTKLFLLCISRYFDKNGRSSSMSYAQISADCSFSEPTSKRAAKAAREWLKIGVQKGFKTASGPQNLYDGIPPAKWIDELRHRKLNGPPVEPDPIIVSAAEGVSQRYPSDPQGVSPCYPSERQGVSQRHPLDQRGITDDGKGYHSDTLTLNTPKEREEGADAPQNPTSTTQGTSSVASSFSNGNKSASPAGRIATGEISRRFEAEWWPLYPKKKDKPDALKAFTKLVASGKATIEQLVAAVRAYKFPADPQFIKHPATWLNKGSWVDVVPQQSAPSASPARISPAQMKPATWRVVIHNLSRTWPEHLGPPPGSPGCLVPADLLRDRTLNLARFSATLGSS